MTSRWKTGATARRRRGSTPSCGRVTRRTPRLPAGYDEPSGLHARPDGALSGTSFQSNASFRRVAGSVAENSFFFASEDILASTISRFNHYLALAVRYVPLAVPPGCGAPQLAQASPYPPRRGSASTSTRTRRPATPTESPRPAPSATCAASSSTAVALRPRHEPPLRFHGIFQP